MRVKGEWINALLLRKKNLNPNALFVKSLLAMDASIGMGGEVRMIVVEQKPVPIYETECYECKSKIQYKAAEVFWGHITCPVCGMSLWANISTPIRFEETEQMNESPKEQT